MRRPSCLVVALTATALAGALPLGAQRPAASADSAAPAVAFFGEVRTRSEYDRPVAPVAPDAFTYLRSRFGARLDVTRGARVVLQVQDSRVLGARANGAASDVFALHQGYLELTAPWREVALAVRAGRQEIALGNERLVGAVAWSNTGRTLDAARVSVVPRAATPGAEPWTVTAFAATVEERGAPDHVAVGLFATRALSGGVALDGTLLHDAGSHYRAYDDARRTTLDARIRAPRVLGLSAQLEGAVQLGTQRFRAPDGAAPAARAQDVRAWLLGARVGTPTSPNRRASASAGVDILSGDADPTDGG
ncbi:MAG TPA: alginate export family protein, partial [Gemmatimonadaceae bacterium]|nr:alginate export family protein [Gemmatimonadaceae bacterium]